MNKKLIKILLFALWTPLMAGATGTYDSTALQIYQFNIDKMIGPPSWHTVQRAVRNAEKQRFDLILIKMNTYGGTLDAADSIRTKILDCPIPVYMFINKNAASAGALIAIACDSIYMTPGASMGAATVVDQTGKPLPDKYQSYMRSLMRSTAEVNGRNPKIAEAMVDPQVYLPGISDSGKVLAFTPSEAVKNGYCEAEVGSIPELLEHAGIKHYQITKHKETTIDYIIGFLIHPFVSGVLIMVMIGGLYFELQTPGIGFPLGAAIIAALLYFAPLYIEGVASHWEILLFLAGLILLALEIFILPGFGISGILGIIFIIGGLTLSMVQSTGPGFLEIDLSGLIRALFVVIISLTASFIFILFIVQKISKSSSFAFIGLQKTQQKEEGYTSATAQYKNKVGKKGISITKLRPAGKVLIDNEQFDAIAEIGFIDKEKTVEVTDYKNAQLVIREIEQQSLESIKKTESDGTN